MLSYNSADDGVREKWKMKEKAIEYYNMNGIPQKMEQILNSTFYDNPDDVYGHLANFFEQFSKPPVISRVTSRHVLDSQGHITLQTSIFCNVKNVDRLYSSTISSSTDNTSHFARLENREQKVESVKKAITYINDDISSTLKGMSPVEQIEIDDLLLKYIQLLTEREETEVVPCDTVSVCDDVTTQTFRSSKNAKEKKGVQDSSRSGKGSKAGSTKPVPEDPPEVLVQGAELVCAVSQSVCVAGAHASGIPLYKHLANIYNVDADRLEMPLPLVTIMQSGVSAAGKQNIIKEFILVPSVLLSLAHVNWVDKHMLLVRHLAPKILMAENYCGRQQVQRLVWAATAYHKKEGANRHPGVRKHGLQYDGRFRVLSVDYITGIYSYVEKVLCCKSGINQQCVNQFGALCPVLDRPEQGLDLLIEAITAVHLTAGQHFHIAINAAAHEYFDLEKGKYEVSTGQYKSPDELTGFWIDLTNRYPSIIMLIDPMRKQEKEQWLKLCDQLTDHCFVCGTKIYPRPGLLTDTHLSQPVMSNAFSLSLTSINCVSDVCRCINKAKDAENEIILSATAGESQDDFIVDLSVATDIRFLKLGAPNRGERTSKLNRLMEIEQELQANGNLAPQAGHTFHHIALPHEDDVEGDQASPAASGRKTEKRKDESRKPRQ